MPEPTITCNRLPVCYLTVPDREVFSACYLPFLDHGGLFVPGSLADVLGQSLLLILQLHDPQVRLAINARVFLLVPERQRGRRPCGTGLKFLDPDGGLRATLDKLLIPVAERVPMLG